MASPQRNVKSGKTDEVPTEGSRGVTVRSVVSGLVLVVGLDALAIHLRYVVHGSLMTYSHVPMAMLIGFTLMILIGALIVRFSGWKLSPAEWHTILAMGVVGAAIPGFGVSGYLIGYIATPYYFATEVNEWTTYLHPYMNPWLIPTDENKAVTWFFEGIPRGAQIPWDAWVLPLLWWTTFIVAAFVVLACVAVIFRKQWVQNERMAFPAMAPLINMAENPGRGKFALPDFTRNYLFWIGFGLAFGMIAWNCINYFLPGFPRFPIYRGSWYWLDRQRPPVFLFLGLFTIFFSYFASLDVLFSIWFFDLLFIFEGGWLHRRGFTAISPYYYRGVYYWQTKGAFVVLTASVFWVARRHIRDVVRNAWRKNDSLDDRDEPLSYRTAVIAMLVGLAFMWLWLTRIGFDPLLAALLLPAVIFTYVGMAKILAETGMPYTNVPAGPWGLVAPFLEGPTVNASTRVALRFASRITSHFKGLFLPALAHAGRVAEGVRGDRRKLMVAVGMAFVTSYGVSVLLTIHMGYRDGAYNFNSWEIVRAGPKHFEGTATSVKNLLAKNRIRPFTVKTLNRSCFSAWAAWSRSCSFTCGIDSSGGRCIPSEWQSPARILPAGPA